MASARTDSTAASSDVETNVALRPDSLKVMVVAADVNVGAILENR